MYKKTSLQPIIDCFERKQTLSIHEITKTLNKSRVIIHKYIKELVKQGILKKNSNGPKTTYTIKTTIEKKEERHENYELSLSYEETTILDNHFRKITPTGHTLTGKEGIIERCHKRKLDPHLKIPLFIKTYKAIQSMKNSCGLIDVTNSFREKIEGAHIDKLYYADQYKWMEFGRGKTAEVTYYAKDTQNKKLIKQSIKLIQRQLECLIQEEKFDAIAYTPHSKKRQIQLLKELQKSLKTKLPHIPLVKYSPTGIIIAQKSLKTRTERIENARRTIIIDQHEEIKNQHVFLIDDFVGSGATLNETAAKFKKAGAQKVSAFAFVGNTNLTYDVIREI